MDANSSQNAEPVAVQMDRLRDLSDFISRRGIEATTRVRLLDLLTRRGLLVGSHNENDGTLKRLFPEDGTRLETGKMGRKSRPRRSFAISMVKFVNQLSAERQNVVRGDRRHYVCSSSSSSLDMTLDSELQVAFPSNFHIQSRTLPRRLGEIVRACVELLPVTLRATRAGDSGMVGTPLGGKDLWLLAD